jgi:predicted amidohydrolase
MGRGAGTQSHELAVRGFQGGGVTMEDFRVVAATMRSPVGKKPENLERMEFWVSQAAQSGAQAVCFPELNISGYGLRGEVGAWAEPIPGPSSDAVVEMARSHNLLILAGLVEEGIGGGFFISQFAVGPEGLLGVYRKIHLGPSEEETYQAGDQCAVFRYGQTTFGIELCFDGHFPELSTLLALQGAEVIFIPHASPRESSEQKQERWLRYLAARAYDNSVFVVACNQVGENESGLAFSGTGLILSPRGEVLAAGREGGEGTILADLKQDTLRGVRENPRGFFLRKRRPDIYRQLWR